MRTAIKFGFCILFLSLILIACTQGVLDAIGQDVIEVNLSAQPLQGDAELKVSFDYEIATQLGQGDDRHWWFDAGDGSPISHLVKTISDGYKTSILSHTYRVPGTYQAKVFNTVAANLDIPEPPDSSPLEPNAKLDITVTAGLNIIVVGEGRVVGEKIDCNQLGETQCKETGLKTDTSVSLNATPSDENWEFEAWTIEEITDQDGTVKTTKSTENPLNLSVSYTTTVSATFTQKQDPGNDAKLFTFVDALKVYQNNSDLWKEVAVNNRITTINLPVSRFVTEKVVQLAVSCIPEELSVLSFRLEDFPEDTGPLSFDCGTSNKSKTPVTVTVTGNEGPFEGLVMYDADKQIVDEPKAISQAANSFTIEVFGTSATLSYAFGPSLADLKQAGSATFPITPGQPNSLSLDISKPDFDLERVDIKADLGPNNFVITGAYKDGVTLPGGFFSTLSGEQAYPLFRPTGSDHKVLFQGLSTTKTVTFVGSKSPAESLRFSPDLNFKIEADSIVFPLDTVPDFVSFIGIAESGQRQAEVMSSAVIKALGGTVKFTDTGIHSEPIGNFKSGQILSTNQAFATSLDFFNDSEGIENGIFTVDRTPFIY